MIKLRLIGSSADLQHLVYSNKKTGKRGSHIVAIDDDLFDVLEDVVRRRRRGEGADDAPPPKPAAPRVVSKIPPKDVQRMLRAGKTPEQVAKSADVPLAWVEQFLVPVLYERQGMAREAQRAWLSKQRLGESGLPLGEAVEANLRARHVRLSDAEMADAWDALRAEGQPWTITLTFRFRGRSQKATWKYDPARRTVTAGNRLGADLGWVAPGKRVRTAERTSRFVTPEPRASRAAAASKPKRAAAKKRVAKKTTAKKTTARKTTARKPAAAKKRVAKKTTRRAPARKRVAKKTTRRAPAKKRVAKKTTRRAPARKRVAKKTTRRAPAKKRTTVRKRTATARRRGRR